MPFSLSRPPLIGEHAAYRASGKGVRTQLSRNPPAEALLVESVSAPARPERLLSNKGLETHRTVNFVGVCPRLVPRAHPSPLPV